MQTSASALRLEDQRSGNLLLGADEARIAPGEHYRTVILLWGNLEVGGEVEKVVVLSGRVNFLSTGKLTQSLVVMGGSFALQPGAGVDQTQITLRSPGPLWRALRSFGSGWRDNIGWVMVGLAALVATLLLWAVGCLLFFAAPAFAARGAGRFVADWAPNLLAGIIGTVLAPVLLVLLVISLLGIAVLPVYLFLLLALGLASYLTAALWTGMRLWPVRAGAPAAVRPWRPGALLLGLAVLQILWMTGAAGVLLVLALWTLAWGATLRSLRAVWK